MILMMILFSTVCWAQNNVIKVYDSQSLNFKPVEIASIDSFVLRNNFIRLMTDETKANDWFLFSRESVLFGNSSVLRQIDRFELFKQYLDQSKGEKAVFKSCGREAFRSLYNQPRIDEKSALRREWEEAFGFDVWKPYYQYKEIERQVKSRLSIRVFKLKGEPRLEKGKVFYVFAANF